MSRKPKANPRIVEIDTGGKLSLAFYAFCRKDDETEMRCGWIRLKKVPFQGKKVFAVDNINVEEDFRERGVATALYTAAAQEACRLRSRLASLSRDPSALSHSFWRKQARKGRVNPIPQKDRNMPAYVLDCPVLTLDGLRRKR